MQWTTLNLRNIYYTVGLVLFFMLMAIKAFAFWLPPIFEVPPVILHPPHFEGGVETTLENMRRDEEHQKWLENGGHVDEKGNKVFLA